MTTEDPGRKGMSVPFARIALLLAALIAVAAVALAALRPRAADGGHEAASLPRTAQPVGDVGSMIGKLEQKLRANPDDARGWQLLGLSYYSVGRYPDAVAAYSRAAALDSTNAEIWSALGEVQLLAGPGGVTPEAERSFKKALAIDARDFRARYFMAVKRDRDGDHRGAVNDWIQILKDSPPGAPWEDSVRKIITEVAAVNKIDLAGRMPAPSMPSPAMSQSPGSGSSVATSGIPGPTSADLKAASAIPPSEQDEMARGMVAQLATRLEANPRDPDRWIMLMRSRVVLKDMSGAKEALSRAKTIFAGDPANLARFDEAARALGIR